MFNSLLRELVLFVLGFIQADDKGHTEALKYRHVVVRCERAISICHVERSRERNKLSWHDPVQVAVFDLLEVLVLLHVKSAIVVPSESHGVLEAEEAMMICAAVGAITHRGVTIGDELVVIWTERLPCLICRLAQDYDHEGAHQEGRVTLLVVVQARVVIYFVVLVLLVAHEFFKFLAKEMNFSQVKRAEIRKKWLIN